MISIALHCDHTDCSRGLDFPVESLKDRKPQDASMFHTALRLAGESGWHHVDKGIFEEWGVFCPDHKPGDGE